MSLCPPAPADPRQLTPFEIRQWVGTVRTAMLETEAGSEYRKAFIASAQATVQELAEKVRPLDGSLATALEAEAYNFRFMVRVSRPTG